MNKYTLFNSIPYNFIYFVTNDIILDMKGGIMSDTHMSRFDKDLYEQIRIISAAKGMTIKEYIDSCLKICIKKDKEVVKKYYEKLLTDK